jgi:hypothetical protein
MQHMISHVALLEGEQEGANSIPLYTHLVSGHTVVLEKVCLDLVR